MSKGTQKKQIPINTVIAGAENRNPAPQNSNFIVKYPRLWLAAIAFLLYLPTITMGVTDLDDGIFINKNAAYNEDLHNLYRSFTHSIFNTQSDQLYRPVINDVMILNYQVANHGANLAAFHLVNNLLHVISVLLLYILLLKLALKKLHAFILTMFLAVSPVLTEAVSWICARIEPLLFIFVVSFFIQTIDYTKTVRLRNLILAALFLMLALFNKETAVAAAPSAFILLMFSLHQPLFSKKSIIQYAVWICCYIIWFIARTSAIGLNSGKVDSSVAGSFIGRMPVMLQYLGKIFFPVNLSVYPMQQDTTYYWGVLIALILGILLYINKNRNTKIVIAGFALFFLFLAPTFAIPKNINVQVFEYRIYIPFIGILLLLSQTPLLQNKLQERKLLLISIGVCTIMAVVTLSYQQSFANPLRFWTQAERTSPHSAYAKMMLAARVDDTDRSNKLFYEAWRLDPNEHLMNFIYGVRLQNEDSVLASEKYLLEEKKRSGYFECDFYLARVAIEKKQPKEAISYLENYLKNDKKNQLANTNLLLLYLDTDQDDKAKKQAATMLEQGLEVPKPVIDHFHL